MKQWLIGVIVLGYLLPVFAKPAAKVVCQPMALGYKVVKNSVYPFVSNQGKAACFFAFYTRNPDLRKDSNGNGNNGDALWYGYYLQNNPKKIYEFPKPEGCLWRDVCTLDAVSFVSLYDDAIKDVSIIGSCATDRDNFTYAFVFYARANTYVVDEALCSELTQILDLTITDLKKYVHNTGYLHALYQRYGWLTTRPRKNANFVPRKP